MTPTPAKEPDGAAASQPLSRLASGASATIVRILGGDAAGRVRLTSLGVLSGARVRVLQTRPALVIEIGETILALDHGVADAILVVRE